jgi:hypothetical protein
MSLNEGIGSWHNIAIPPSIPEALPLGGRR